MSRCPYFDVCPFLELWQSEEAELLVESCHDDWEECVYFKLNPFSKWAEELFMVLDRGRLP